MKQTSNYFSGFCLENESELFKDYIIKNDFTLNAFSYGAIKAFSYALNTKDRIDLIQLFSPAFFQTNDKKFVRLQIMFFKKDEKSYCENFLSNITYPSSFSCDKYFKKGSLEELEELLTYKWNEKKLQELLNKGVEIEVYLGEKDKIIDSSEAMNFFTKYANVYFIKNVGHTLQK